MSDGFTGLQKPGEPVRVTAGAETDHGDVLPNMVSLSRHRMKHANAAQPQLR
jgi:hypothetical protein